MRLDASVVAAESVSMTQSSNFREGWQLAEPGRGEKRRRGVVARWSGGVTAPKARYSFAQPAGLGCLGIRDVALSGLVFGAGRG
jgi:hypothetical protein